MFYCIFIIKLLAFNTECAMNTKWTLSSSSSFGIILSFLHPSIKSWSIACNFFFLFFHFHFQSTLHCINFLFLSFFHLYLTPAVAATTRKGATPCNCLQRQTIRTNFFVHVVSVMMVVVVCGSDRDNRVNVSFWDVALFFVVGCIQSCNAYTDS